MPSIRKIAEAAGVSVSTASKALNNKADVSEKTREKVMDIAKKIGYFPNPIAKRLSAKKTNLIGILILNTAVLEIGSSIFMKLLGDISRMAAKKGYDILLMTPDEEMSYIEMAKRSRIDGLIIMGLTLNDKNLSEITNSDIPMIILDQTVDGKAAISTDNIDGIEQVTKHILSRGCQRIAFAGYYEGSQASIERYEGYKKAIGCEKTEIYSGGFSFEDGVRIGKEIVNQATLPEAIVCVTDMVALGIIKSLTTAGIKVPEDILISGFDNLLSGRISTPELTTVAQDTDKIAMELLEGVIEVSNGKKINSKAIKGKIIIRESTRRE